MVPMKIELLLVLSTLYVTDCERRIHHGKVANTAKKYMVYLVKAKEVNSIDDDQWLCGGALVTNIFIITSAACVSDVEFIYVIAGYKKKVYIKDLETDECTKKMKKKLVYYCVPTHYSFNLTFLEEWSYIDIALAKVESAYNFNDNTYEKICSYKPTVIPINYEPKFQSAGIDALVFGWGHERHLRQYGDHAWSYNQEYMNYVSTTILDKPTCKEQYASSFNMTDLIDEFMICTLKEGEIDEKGDFVPVGPKPRLDGCIEKKQMLNGKYVLSKNSTKCKHHYYHDFLVDDTRRGDTNQNSSNSIQNRTDFNTTATEFRRHGICQNDHGGALVTWMGGREILIGIASVFKVSKDNKCMGPYLFTSTVCNGIFIDCILGEFTGSRRSQLCSKPPILRGFDIYEKHISWKNHSAGPADNERDDFNGTNGH